MVQQTGTTKALTLLLRSMTPEGAEEKRAQRRVLCGALRLVMESLGNAQRCYEKGQGADSNRLEGVDGASGTPRRIQK
jgi:hypothetical protein